MAPPLAPPALVCEDFFGKGMVGVGRWHFGRLESGLQGYGGFWMVLGGVGWALAALVCKGMVDLGSIWVGLGEAWLSFFAREWLVSHKR